MPKNSSVTHLRTYTSKGMIPGVMIGGFLGILTGFLHRTGILIIPGISSVFSTIPFNEIITGTLLGIIIGGLLGEVLALYYRENINVEHLQETSVPKQNLYENNKNSTFQIKKEELDIAKKWIQTGDVRIYRETFTEEKNFIVPVKREELVIEKITLASDTPKHKDMHPEIIRILLNEEHVDFTKRKVALEDVSIYKQQIEDIKHIEETLKEEIPKVKVSGSPKVRDESNLKQP